MTVADVSDHEAGRIDGEGHTRCDACGYRWPCPSVRAQPRPLTQDEVDFLLSLDIGVGYSVALRKPEGSDDASESGRIVGMFDDEDDRLTFRVLDFPHGKRRVRLIRLDEVEPAAVQLPNASFVRSDGRRLALIVGQQKASDGDEVEILADAIDLFRSIDPRKAAS